MNKNVISLIRMISLLMIISCHILQGLNNSLAFWVNVGVQIFLFISGFLYGNKKITDAKEFYKKRFFKIFLPYFIFMNIILLIEYIILKYTYSFRYILGNTLGMGGLIGTYSIISHTWFMSYILLCYILTPILDKCFNNDFKHNLINFVLICAFLQILEFYGIFNLAVIWIINYILGYFYARTYEDSKNRKKLSILVFIAFIIVISLVIMLETKVTVLPIIKNFAVYIDRYGHVLLGSTIFIILYEILKKVDIKDNKLLSFSDKYSYYIYLTHQVFILGAFSLLFLTKILTVNILIIFICSILSGILLEFICNKILKVISKK